MMFNISELKSLKFFILFDFFLTYVHVRRKKIADAYRYQEKNSRSMSSCSFTLQIY